MALQIRTAATIELPTTIKMMVYGQAGMGKTTLALSMPQPLLLDFDGGVARVNTSHLDGVAVAQISRWEEALELFNTDLSPFKTVIVDTAGKMMDMILTYRCGNRQPKLNEWGGINSEFNNFTRDLANLGKNVIYVAHRESTKDGDNQVYIPMLRSKSFTSIVTELDLLGYLEMRQINGRVERTITYNPTERSEGKNACNLPGVMTIPTIIDDKGNPVGPNNFLEENVLKPYLNMLKTKRDTQAAYAEALQSLKEDIEAVIDADTANQFVANLDSYKGKNNLYAKARQLFSARVKELPIQYNTKKKCYEPAA